MTIQTTLLEQKTHIIYGVIIVLIGSVAYHFFKKDPEIITKTLTKIQTVTQDKVVYVDRVIITKKKNGDVIREVDHQHSDTKTKDVATTTQKEVQSFMKNYSIEFMFPPQIPTLSGLYQSQVSVGMRIFSTPLWVVAGINGQFNAPMVGIRWEF